MQRLPKGIHTVSKTLKSGDIETYIYAWRGGPRLFEKPGTDDFQIEYGSALQSRREPDETMLLALIYHYRISPKFKKLAPSTKKYRSLYLDEIQVKFGKMSIFALNDISVKEDFVNWRDSFSATPKGADMRIETLRVMLGVALERGKIQFNHAKGISNLYDNDRSDIIWTASEIAKVKENASPACARAIDLARLTGIRKGDLIKLDWKADKGQYIEWKTSKSGKRVFVPILPELRALLDSWTKGEQILTNSHGTAWKAPALQNAFRRAKLKAQIDKRFHDFRGTFATMLIEKGVSDERVGDIMGWSKYKIAEIRRVYVDNSAIIADVLRQLSVN